VFEHAVDGVQEFTHDGDDGLELGFASSHQMLVKPRKWGSCCTVTNAGMYRARRRCALPDLLMMVFLATEVPEV